MVRHETGKVNKNEGCSYDDDGHVVGPWLCCSSEGSRSSENSHSVRVKARLTPNLSGTFYVY